MMFKSLDARLPRRFKYGPDLKGIERKGITPAEVKAAGFKYGPDLKGIERHR